MNQRSDIDRVLQVWMGDGPTAIPDRVVDVVAARIGVQRQRRTWPFHGRTNVTTQIKLAAGLAAVLVVAVVAWQLLPGDGDVGSKPTPIPSPATTGPVALADGPLAGGPYRIETFGLSIVAVIPPAWQGYPSIPALVSPGETSNTGTLIGFMEPESLFSDPCQWDLDGTGSDTQPGDIVPGPSVDDLVSALKANTSYTSSEPTAITFGAYEGQALSLQLPGNDVLSTCDTRPEHPDGDYFPFSNGFYAQGPDSHWDLVILDVDGTRLVVMMSFAAGSTEAEIDAARGIVESFEFTP